MVVGDFTRIGAVRECRYVAWTRLVAGILLVAEELTDEELDQQEDTETLEGTLEAKLDDRQSTIKGRQLHCPKHIRWPLAPVCAAFVPA